MPNYKKHKYIYIVHVFRSVYVNTVSYLADYLWI